MEITTLSISQETLCVRPATTSLVASNAPRFSRALQSLPSAGRRLELNLSSVRRVDGAGVGALLSCHRALQRGGRALVLTHLQPHLEWELKACGLQRMLAQPGDAADPGRPAV